MTRPVVQSFLHKQSSTWTYVVHDGRSAAIVDPALDFDAPSGRTGTGSVEAVVQFVQKNGLTVEWILETHAHADHLTAAPFIKRQLDGHTAIGAGIRKVQSAFKDLLDLEPAFAADGRQFDHLFHDDETFRVGSLEGRVMPTPGHTEDSVSYLIGDAVFTGDSLFMPDSGTARCDFPGGDARVLYASIRRLYALPGETRVFVCHDYGAGGREHRCETTIAAERESNIHLREDVSEAQFIALRTERDATLSAPGLLYPAVQVNIRAGHLPPAAANGRRYLKMPVF